MVVVGLLGGCGSEAPRAVVEEPDVLVDAFSPTATLIYRDGDGPWQLLPTTDDRLGFDVTDTRYGIAAIDPIRRRVDAVYSTVLERPHVSWQLPELVDTTPRHTIRGTVGGSNAFGGIVAGGRETAMWRAGEPYELAVPEGERTIVFGRYLRLDEEGARVSSLIVRRDVAIAADVAMNVDLDSEGLPAQTLPFPVPLANGCPTRSTFTFDHTETVLATTVEQITFPHGDQWLATDHLTVRIECPSQVVTLQIAAPELIPTQAPAQLLSDGEVLAADFHFQFVSADAELYEITLGCVGGCPVQWQTRVTEGWLDPATIKDVAVLAPGDLAELGLLDGLELPHDLSWSFATVARDETRTTAEVSGVFAW